MRFAWMAALCLTAPTVAIARPYSVEDMLAAGDYGRALFSPQGDRVVVERLGGQRDAARFTYDYFVRRARSRVLVAPVSGSSGLTPLFSQAAGAGYWIGGFSPSGRRLAVYRLRDDRITLGIVDMASRRVKWLAVTPDLPAGQVNPVWIDENRMLVVALPSGGLPLPLDFGGRAQKKLSASWERTARGRVAAMTITGSGSDLQAGVTYGRRHLVMVDVTRPAIRSLATGDFVDLALAPDRRHIALLERGDAVPAPPATVPLSLDFQSRRLRLRIVALAGSSSAPCPTCDLAPDLLAWSADGSRLLFFARTDADPWDRGVLYAHDVRTGRAVPLDTSGVRPTLIRTTPGRATVRAGWFGGRPILFGMVGSGRADWFLLGDGDPVRMTGDVPAGAAAPMRVGHGVMCTLAGDGFWSITADGAARAAILAKDLSVVSDPVGAYDVGTRLLFEQVRDTPTVWLRRADGKGAELIEARCGEDWSRPVARVEANTSLLAVAPRGGVAVAVTVSPQGVGTLSLVGRGARLLDSINRGLAVVDRPMTMALRRGGPDGPLTDWLLLPAHTDPNSKLPLIIMPYPGTIFGDAPPPDFGLADFLPMLGPPLLAAHGYAVLEPSLPIGMGEPVDDIPAALRPAIAAAIRTGRIDPARIGVLGHSYGGYAALMMATEMPCLRSVVASASASDLLLSYGDFDPRLKVDFAEGLPTTYPFAWSEGGQGRMGGPPWKDPVVYLRNSPFYRLDRVTASILLLHGDLDPISVVQAERTYGALYRLGKDARLVRFYGEGHVPASPATIRARWRETFAWLDRTMAPRPAGIAGTAFDDAGACTPPLRP